ncbi:MAG: hypothetical protein SVZ03_14755 [Spirochaetota bacterium]|nr:hypothetical protein [Spirochaetota bacterium]
MTVMNIENERIVIPSVDLGGTKIDFAFVRADKKRQIAFEYPQVEVIKENGKIDIIKTLQLIAKLITERTSEVNRMGWVVLKLLGMGAPGLYLSDGSVDPRTVPNIPGLAQIKPAEVLAEMLGNGWRVYINNDGVVQAIASSYAFVQSTLYREGWAGIVEESGGRMIYLGPGTGFGAGKVLVRQDKQVVSMSGSSAFFDILIRDGKTAEDLLSGTGLAKIAQSMEIENLKEGKPLLSKFIDMYDQWERNSQKSTEKLLNGITGKVIANAYYSDNIESKSIAKEIFIQAGRDLARLMIQLYEGEGDKAILEWEREDWDSVKGVSVFLVAGLLIKPAGKDLILPSARETLEKMGYSNKIYIIETDQLPIMKDIQNKIGILGSSLIVPKDEILKQRWAHFLIVGEDQINHFIVSLIKGMILENEGSVIIAIDGYIGVEWQKISLQIEMGLEKDSLSVQMIDFSLFFKSPERIDEIIRPYIGEEKTFGRIFDRTLDDLLDEDRVATIKKIFLDSREQSRSDSPQAIICFGSGAACSSLLNLYDVIIYKDLTREEITKRYQKGMVCPLGAGRGGEYEKGQPAYLTGKRYHYIDFPIVDAHKGALQNRIHYYIDDNLSLEPKLVTQRVLDEMVSHLADGPIQLKAFHDAGVWGGQWLKRIRNLPKEMVNCAWGYELMAYQMSVKIPLGDFFMEIPFANILDKESDKIMGKRVNRLFDGFWPIRINYDDCWEGGDMAIQIHPDSSYIKTNFNEPLHQDESYYVIASTPDAYVYLGMKEGICLQEFYEDVRKAETEGIPFDHRKYVNVFPARAGDLFLIPAGTLHASGKGCVVLELSSTTDRYTFHFYDFLRKDLNGELREIHSKHAFNMANKYSHRTTSWVKKHLIQEPRLLRNGDDWAEYLIGRLEELVFEVHRFEFVTRIEDDTEGVPHVLSMVEGCAVLIKSICFPERQFDLSFSETLILPSRFGKYEVINLGDKSCKVVKTLVNTSCKWNDDRDYL